MPEDKKTNLKWHFDAMEWRDEDGKAVKHPRYKDSPSSLTSKSFIKGYLKEFKSKAKGSPSLNNYMKTHQKYSSKDIQDAAKDFRLMFEAASPGNTFSLLSQKKDTSAAKKKKQQAAILDLVTEMKLSKKKQSREKKANKK